MKDDSKTLERLGEQAAEILGQGPAGERREAQKRALISAMALPGPAAGRRRMWVPALAAAAVLIVVSAAAAAFLLTRGKPAQFWIDGSQVVDASGVRLQAPAEKTLSLRFEDGSMLDLDPGASGRITTATQKQVTMVLSAGTVSASIRKAAGRTWTVEAGPYTVTVTGTEFSVQWHEGQALLRVMVTEGSVLVTGGDLADKGVTLLAGDLLHIDGRKGILSIGPAQEEKETALASGPAPEEPGGPVDDSAPEEAGPTAAVEQALEQKNGHEAKEPMPEWKALAKSGMYAEALAAADRAGLDGLLETATLADLWLLADAARYARDADKAEKILLSVRGRFKGTKRAKMAAFLLGRVALELGKDPAEGAQWFSTYLVEDPGGPLAEEALGRLMGAQLKAGQKSQARQSAEQYLDKYESGSFAELAKNVLGK
jgi:transmembrane sensor